MIGLVLPWALVAACAAAGAWAYALVRQERAAYRGRVLSDRGLYEAGEAAATERKKPKLPRLARALHEAGVETPAANWAAGVAAIAFVSLSLAAALTGDPGIGAVVGAAALATAGVRLHVRRLRRRELLDRQLARALPQIAASVRSSLTLERALRTAASHVEGRFAKSSPACWPTRRTGRRSRWRSSAWRAEPTAPTCARSPQPSGFSSGSAVRSRPCST